MKLLNFSLLPLNPDSSLTLKSNFGAFVFLGFFGPSALALQAVPQLNNLLVTCWPSKTSFHLHITFDSVIQQRGKMSTVVIDLFFSRIFSHTPTCGHTHLSFQTLQQLLPLLTHDHIIPSPQATGLNCFFYLLLST